MRGLAPSPPPAACSAHPSPTPRVRCRFWQVRLLEDTPKLNLALITIGEDYDKAVFSRYLAAAKGGSAPSQGMHVAATNMASIAKAFERIAQTMAASTAGASD